MARRTQVDLNLLYTFRVFTDLGSVAKTAKFFGRSQPAISARLHQLESEMGIQLLERAGRNLRLTPVGRTIYRESLPLLDGVHRLLDKAWESDKESSGHLRIGALPTLSVYIMAPVISRFTGADSSREIELICNTTHELLLQLKRGELDMVASVGPPPSDPQLHVTILGRVGPVLAAAKDSTDFGPGQLSAQQLMPFLFVGYGQVGDPFFDAVWSFMRNHKLESKVRTVVSHIQTLKSLALAGSSLVILPDYTVTEDGFCTWRVKDLDFGQDVWMAVRNSACAVPIVDLLCNTLYKETARLRQND